MVYSGGGRPGTGSRHPLLHYQQHDNPIDSATPEKSGDEGCTNGKISESSCY
jgi:hypothetical protein